LERRRSDRVGQGTIEQYRLYVVAHELGHLVGKGHEPLPTRIGDYTPIMYQATKGIPIAYKFDPEHILRLENPL
jgi:hypothetical protein